MDPRVPADTRLWAALQNASGGPWGGCVYDADRVTQLLKLGERAERLAPSAGLPAASVQLPSRV
jgi:xylonate dehydratase